MKSCRYLKIIKTTKIMDFRNLYAMDWPEVRASSPIVSFLYVVHRNFLQYRTITSSSLVKGVVKRKERDNTYSNLTG